MTGFPSFRTARNHLGVELGADATAAQVGIVAGHGLDFAVLPAGPAARIAPVVPGIGLVVRDPDAGVLDRLPDGYAGWQPAHGLPACAGPPDVPVFVHVDARGPLTAAVRTADVVRVVAPDVAEAGAARERIRAVIATAGRDPDRVPVLLDLEVLVSGRGRRQQAGRLLAGSVVAAARVIEAAVRQRAADGVTLVPLDPEADLRHITADLVPLLAGRGLFRPGTPGPLRRRLDLAPPAEPVPTRTVEIA